MAEKNKSVKDGGIVFGDWKLFPVDDRNWELCHLRATNDNQRSRAAGTAGVVQWSRTGRFYSYHTIDLAMLYAADVEMKDKHRQKARELIEVAREWRETLEGFRADMKRMLDSGTA